MFEDVALRHGLLADGLDHSVLPIFLHALGRGSALLAGALHANLSELKIWARGRHSCKFSRIHGFYNLQNGEIQRTTGRGGYVQDLACRAMDSDPDYVLITIARLSIVARARAVSGCEGTRRSELVVVLLSLGPTPLGARRRARVPCVLSVDARTQSII
mmetsp:Transcript_77745/g.126122  ORF Transcript_77745/g.126122 Transcript_77745/m.126122 type:complete len:159 (+) Transcript_77745:1551-2027(+)